MRIIGGFCYLQNERGETVVAVPVGSSGRVGNIFVGDLVDYEMLPSDQGVIEECSPRKTELKRPLCCQRYSSGFSVRP